MYAGEVPEDLFIEWPYNPAYNVSPTYLTKENIEYVRVDIGMADVFELELLQDSIILFTDKQPGHFVLFKIPVTPGKYRLLKQCISYVQVFVEKGKNYISKRWLAKDGDLYRSLYEICIGQTINGVTFYYYDGSLHVNKREGDVNPAEVNPGEIDEHIERFIKMNFLRC